ncbi:MAG TPA: TRAP transporter TatT component family protein [Pyrinomonadaceae bacterium]|nr:TRAP transporter TatT component family protein [Pyrinomonadaceae bacterium]
MNPSIEELISRADALYNKREDLENVRASVRLLQEAVRAGEYEALWRRGRALFFLGQEALDKEEARTLHARALHICEQAAQTNPQRVEGYFWLGVNQALLAQAENHLKALRHAASARRSLRRAVRIDAAYHGAGPLRVLARLQHKLPRILGGGRARARANFERAIELEPANTVTRIYFAEFLLEMGDTNQARLELDALLNAPPDDAWAFEQKRDRRLARKMLGGL